MKEERYFSSLNSAAVWNDFRQNSPQVDHVVYCIYLKIKIPL